MDLPSAMLDINRICRVCMCSEEDLVLIFDEKLNMELTSVANMLTECTSFSVELHDEFPHHICRGCLEAVKNAFCFKRQCEKTYRTLLQLLSTTTAATAINTTTSSCIKTENIHHIEQGTQTDNTILYPCESCDTSFAGQKARDRDIEQNEIQPKCRFCKKTFNRIEYLKTHIAVVHTESDQTMNNECRICKRQFTKLAHLRRHLVVIHKIVENYDEMPALENSIDMSVESPSTAVTLECENYEFSEYQSPGNSASGNCSATFTRTENSYEAKYEIQSMDEETAAAINSDEDEQPLANFINSTPIKAFMEVILNESAEFDEKISIDALASTEKSVDDQSLMPKSPESTDVFAAVPVKRRRGRPRRNKREKFTNQKTKKQLSTAECEYEYYQSKCAKILEDSDDQQHEMLHCANNQQSTCKICLESFECADDLKEHIRREHASLRQNECIDCDKVFMHINQFKRLMKQTNKHNDKEYECRICSKSFTSKIYLQRHEKVHDRKRYVCKECSETFLSKDELSMHIKSKGHDKPMLCPECGLRCKTSNILMVHMRRHNGEKPFKCKFCSKGFPRMDDLRVHEKYHTGEKSHFCETCGKGFQRKYNLTIHLRVHTGEKPYKCPHCPQAFAQGNDLKAHVRRHTGERFRCELCGAAFLQGYQIRQHKLTEHGIKEDPPTQRVAKFTSPEEQEQQIKQNLQKELAKAMDTTVESENHVETNNAENDAVIKEDTELLEIATVITNLPETMSEYIQF